MGVELWQKVGLPRYGEHCLGGKRGAIVERSERPGGIAVAENAPSAEAAGQAA